MKNIITLGITSILLMLISCADPCKDITCNEVGACDDGTCICDAGYEGTNCETEVRTKYLGSFSGLSTCDDGTNPIPFTFTFTANPTDVSIIDISEPLFFGDIMGTLNGNVLTIDDVVEDEFDIEFSFTFTSNDNADLMFINTNTTDNTVTTCQGSFTRQ